MVSQRTDDDLRAKVRRDPCDRSKWRVENYDDGGDELGIFSDTEARQQALRFANRKYGDFIEVDDLTAAGRQAAVFALKKLINGYIFASAVAARLAAQIGSSKAGPRVREEASLR